MATVLKREFAMQCPVPIEDDSRITMAHGGGGLLTQRLVESVFLPLFRNDMLEARHDGAVFPLDAGRFAFTTDSYVVSPVIFPGGTIGDLAVNGTVNDLAMCGAKPLFLSCGFILEEGFPVGSLREIAESMRRAADQAGVLLVTGDTKVVDRGKADGVFINTAGIGEVRHPVGAARIREGDAIIVSGDLGAHGITILCTREGLNFDSPTTSDTAPLWEPVEALISEGIDVHCLRDLTRGGLSSALNELAGASGLAMQVEESAIPVSETVKAACEVLGLDPFYVANEGRFAAFVPARQAEEAVEILRCLDVTRDAAIAGVVRAGGGIPVTVKSVSGGERALTMLSGDQLPRIC
jgi:hydrogenase expression/formation protein HypE